MFIAFNAHNWKAMEELYTDDAILTDPVYSGTRHGKAEMAAWYKTIPDIRDEIKALQIAGNVVTVEFISTGTQNGKKFR